jgi:hypothetical protein
LCVVVCMCIRMESGDAGWYRGPSQLQVQQAHTASGQQAAGSRKQATALGREGATEITEVNTAEGAPEVDAARVMACGAEGGGGEDGGNGSGEGGGDAGGGGEGSGKGACAA